MLHIDMFHGFCRYDIEGLKRVELFIIIEKIAEHL